MDVEIYNERELDSSLLPECDDESLDLISELGLQTMESGAPISYPIVTKEQQMVIRTMFSSCKEISEYNAGRIPLRVLKEIKKYRDENPDHHLVIFYEPELVIEDPILLAFEPGTSREYSWKMLHGNPRLIARWGNALAPWADLFKAAARKKAEHVKRLLLRARSEIDASLDLINETGEWHSIEEPMFHNTGVPF